jgi:hypothetical protein
MQVIGEPDAEANEPRNEKDGNAGQCPESKPVEKRGFFLFSGDGHAETETTISSEAGRKGRSTKLDSWRGRGAMVAKWRMTKNVAWGIRHLGFAIYTKPLSKKRNSDNRNPRARIKEHLRRHWT